MTTPSSQPPATTGVHHFSPTVSDVEVSAEWYMRVFGMQRLEAHIDGAFDERRTGLDHLAWGVAEHADLDAWTSWLDEIGVPHSGVIDKSEPVPYSTVVFRDPDNIQLELVHLAG